MMTLKIITPAKILYTGETSLVKLPGVKGEFEILENHAPIISALQKGVVNYIDTKGENVSVTITGGFVVVRKNLVEVCAEIE